jgi:predicted GTPase
MFPYCPTPPLKIYINLKGLPNKKFSDTACTIFAFENRSYLGEFEAEFKKALARKQESRVYCLMKKTDGRKSRDTVPLSAQLGQDEMVIVA